MLNFHIFYLSQAIYSWWKNKSQHKTIMLTLIMLTLSIIPLVFIIQLSLNVMGGILNRYENILTYPITLRASQELTDIQTTDLKEIIYHNSQVKFFLEETRFLSLLYTQDKRLPVLSRGIQVWDTSTQEYISSQQVPTPFLPYIQSLEGIWSTEANSVVIGQFIAKQLDLKLGDSINWLSVKRFDTQYIPIKRSLTVQGIVSFGYELLDKNWMFINTQLLQSLAIPHTESLYWGVYPTQTKNISSLSTELKSKTFPFLNISSAKKLNLNKQNTFYNTSFLLYIIASIVLIVAGFNLIACIFSLVWEKKQNMAILYALGLSTVHLRFHFFLLINFIAVLAVFLGISLGLILFHYINEIFQCLEFILNIFYRITLYVQKLPYENQLSLLNPAFYLYRIPNRIYMAPLIFIATFSLLLSSLLSFLSIRKLYCDTSHLLRY